MGREAYLTINYKFSSDRILDIIKILVKSGWSYYHNNGYVEYLPIGDNDDYDWQSEQISLDEIEKIIINKQEQKETIGINLYYHSNKCGISILTESEGKFLFDLDIDRKTLNKGVTDIAWYYNTIIIPLINSGCILDHIRFEEYIG